MVLLHSLRAARAGLNRLADPIFVNTAADANDHENDLQFRIAFVKNDSQLELRQGDTSPCQRCLTYGARNGWQGLLRLGKLCS